MARSFFAWICLDIKEDDVARINDSYGDCGDDIEVLIKDATGKEMTINSFYLFDMPDDNPSAGVFEIPLEGQRPDEDTVQELKDVLDAFCDKFGCDGYVKAATGMGVTEKYYIYDGRAGNLKTPLFYDDDNFYYSEEETEGRSRVKPVRTLEDLI